MAPHKNRLKNDAMRETCAERINRLNNARSELLETLHALHAKLLVATGMGRLTPSDYLQLQAVYQRCVYLLMLPKTKARFPLSIRLRMATKACHIIIDALNAKMIISDNDAFKVTHTPNGKVRIKRYKVQQTQLETSSRDFWQAEYVRLKASNQLEWMKA